MKSVKPIRVLHVVGGLDRGGIETWLVHILRTFDRMQFQMDFVTHTERPGAYDDDVRAVGSRIFRCTRVRRPLSYARQLRQLLAQHGPYDIVHSHVHRFSGHVLRSARQAGVPVRLAHSHIDATVAERGAGTLRRLYLALMNRLIARNATAGLAASRQAAGDLFGPRWQSDPRWQVLYYGVDLAPFQNASSVNDYRREDLGLRRDAFVMGHVGRFAEQKNHSFLLEIAAETARRLPEMHLVLVGDGALRPNIEQRVAELGLGDKVTFWGARPDVPQLMRQVMDVFVFPSLYEGLPLVGIEAQAAGLPCVVSDHLPLEMDMVPGLICRLSLSEPASRWAEAVVAARATARTVNRLRAFDAVAHSPFSISRSVKHLEDFYRACVGFTNR